MNNTIQPQENGDFIVMKPEPVINCPATGKPLTMEIHHIKRDTAENLDFWEKMKNNTPKLFKGYEAELKYWQNINQQLKKIA